MVIITSSGSGTEIIQQPLRRRKNPLRRREIVLSLRQTDSGSLSAVTVSRLVLRNEYSYNGTSATS